MANMNPDEVHFIEGFFEERTEMETSGGRRIEPIRQRSRQSDKQDSPNELSMNLTITSRESHRRVERKKEQISEVSEKHHVRLHRGVPRTPLEIAASQLDKFNSWVQGFERKGAELVAVMDRVEKFREDDTLRNQAYNDIHLLEQEVKRHHRQKHLSSKEVCGPSGRSSHVNTEKPRLQIEQLRNSIRQRQAQIDRLKDIIRQTNEENGNALAILQNKLVEMQQSIEKCNDKLLAMEVASTVEIMGVLAEKQLETTNLNQQIKNLTDKVTDMYRELEQTNMQKSTLMSQTKNLEHKLSQFTQSSNNRPASGSKNISLGEFTMRHLSFSIDPTEQDVHEWVHIFDQYYKHYTTKSNEQAADFFNRKGKKMTSKDKEGSEYTMCKSYFQQIVDLLKSMQTVKERFNVSRPEQKSPLKQLQLHRNSHNTSSDVLLGCPESKLKKKEPANDMELQMCKRSLDSMKKQCQQLQQENCNLTETIDELKKQLEFFMSRKQQDSILVSDEASLHAKIAEYEAKIKQLEEQRSKLQEKFMKMKIMVKQRQTLQKQLMKDKNELIEKCNSLQLQVKDLQYHLENEILARRKLHNELEDFKGNIRVYCRIRPLIANEIERNCQIRVSNHFDNVTAVSDRPYNFHYDMVFGSNSSQEEVFEETKKMVQSAFDGYNVCIFAYGQTGSGKTFTMHGTEDHPGLAYRSIDELYNLIAKNHKFCNITVEMQMVEIYLDNVYDLFDKSRKPLDIYEDKDTKEVIVKDGYRFKVKQAADMHNAYRQGLANRKMSVTQMNAQSSRSHLLFMVRVEVEFKDGKDKKKRRGMLNIIDLAGSEKASKAGLKESQKKESVAINSSLMNLGRVLTALNNKDAHIPYRQSKLTYLLRDSLGGNSKTLMFVNVSPADYNIIQTLTSLTFAKNVKSIERSHAQVNMVRERLNSQQEQKVDRMEKVDKVVVRRPLSKQPMRLSQQ